MVNLFVYGVGTFIQLKYFKKFQELFPHPASLYMTFIYVTYYDQSVIWFFGPSASFNPLSVSDYVVYAWPQESSTSANKKYVCCDWKFIISCFSKTTITPNTNSKYMSLIATNKFVIRNYETIKNVTNSIIYYYCWIPCRKKL